MNALQKNRTETIARSGAQREGEGEPTDDMWPILANTDKIAELLRSFHKSGAIAQLGERIVRNDEVAGSRPASSTSSSS